MGNWLRSAFITTAVFGGVHLSEARPYSYPERRYTSAASEALGDVAVPLTDEVGNDLFNNPAALARNTKFKAEYINANLEGNSNLLSGLGAQSLGSLNKSVTQNPGKLYGYGYGDLTALSWGGLGVGLLLQDRTQAVTSGANTLYETNNQFIPAIGYGVALARGVVRLGYSLQYVNEVEGTGSVVSSSSASMLSGLYEGRGMSHNASVNFVFPYMYTPTFSVMGRNLGGLHFVGGSLFVAGKNPIGVPKDEPMTLDAAYNMTVRFSSSFKSLWYFQYADVTSQTSTPYLQRFSAGIDFQLSQSFSVKIGANGLEPSAGIGYRSESSEINLAWYQDANPLTAGGQWDTRYTLQYKLFFQDKSSRNRDSTNKGE